MNKYEKILENVKEMPFSLRLKYFMNEYYSNKVKAGIEIENNIKKPLSVNELSKKSSDTDGTIITARNIHKYLSGETVSPTDDTITRLAELLYIPFEYLKYDLGRHYRTISKSRHELDGDMYIDNFLDKNGKLSIYGDYEFDGNEFTDESELENRNNEVKLITKKIEEKYYGIKLINCYKLVKCYYIYIKIHEYAWNLLCNYSCLNSKGKEKIKKCISQISTSLDFQVKHLNIFTKHILDFIDMRDEIELGLKKCFYEEFKKYENESEMKVKLWKELHVKLEKESLGTIELFYEQMESILTMEFEDWNILIAYFLLTDSSFYMPTENQQMLLSISKELLDDPFYSNLNKYNN